jgi:hypothetical protein
MASYAYTFTSGDTVTPTKLNNARTVSEIVNADIKSDAAIAGTKIAPAFGAQDITVGGGARLITNTSDFALIFGTNNTERVRINNLGNMGIGTLADIGAKLDVRAGTLRLSTNNDRTTVYGINRGDTGSTNGMASIGMFGSGANGYQGNIIFSTSGTDVFNASLTERMRIDGSGNVLINTQSASVSNSLSTTIETSGFDASRITVNHSSGGSSNDSNYVQFGYGGSLIGRISQNNTTSVAYLTTSDYRLKENVAPMTGALAKVTALKPCTFRWKSSGQQSQGFIAHELQEVCPEAVGGAKDATDSEGKPIYQGVDASYLVATLAAAIQELTAKVEALEAA